MLQNDKLNPSYSHRIRITNVAVRKEVASNLWYLLIFRGHVFFGLIAITVGPFQFVKRILKGNKSIHRRIGYVYFISVLISSVCGIMVAPFAMGGWITSLGFTILSVTWGLITVKSVLAIRGGDLESHQRWVFYSYGFTFSAITQRTLLLIPLLTNVSFMPIYQLSAWLPWILNLIIASLLLKRTNRTLEIV
ncbi:MAG: hypothetical protein CMP48_04720 [Rickettsiales bacterium]|nr:hypothetical protein [Rickettsiales bacterium]